MTCADVGSATTHNRDTTGRINASLTTQHDTALFTEQFRYDARGRTTAHMQSFGDSTGAFEHSRAYGVWITMSVGTSRS